MENATKALLIAGGVLIAIIIISVLVKTYGNIGAFQRQQMTAEEARQLEEFNKEYTKYEGQYVYGTEVITVINRVANEQEKNNIEFTITIGFKEPYSYTKRGKTYTTKGKLVLKGDEQVKYEFIDSNNNQRGNLEELKNRAFKCTDIGYDSYGRVNKIEFEEKIYNGGQALE